MAHNIKNSLDHKRKFKLLFALVVALTSSRHFTADACSSRAVPKPRPSTSSSSSSISATQPAITLVSTTTTTTTTTTPRPNITFPTYKCPETYDAWYCLNEATCFSVKIGDSIMYNCECAIGFMGPRCEYKELDGSYLPKLPRPMVEKASIASGATCALLFVLIICLTLYYRYEQRTKSMNEEMLDGGRCRYCNDKRCFGDTDYPSLLGGNDGYRSSLRKHIETIPMSFATKRSTKL